MNKIINIKEIVIGNEAINAVNSREIYKYLKVNTDFTVWIQRAIDKYDFREGEDYIIRKVASDIGRPKTEYIVSLDMAKELCMVSKSKKGKEVRRYFIEVEKQARKPLTFEEMAKQTIMMANERIAALEKEIETEYKPKALFADTVSSSDTSLLIGQFAKAISNDEVKIGQNKLFDWLRYNGYLIAKGERRNIPKQEYINNGYFEVIERTILSSKKTRTVLTTKITGRGQVALTPKILEAFGK